MFQRAFKRKNLVCERPTFSFSDGGLKNENYKSACTRAVFAMRSVMVVFEIVGAAFRRERDLRGRFTG